MKSFLENHLERAIKRHGEDSFIAQSLRDQIHAQETGKSAEDIYVTGSVKRAKEPPSSKGDK
jgi:hypothetical protein